MEHLNYCRQFLRKVHDYDLCGAGIYDDEWRRTYVFARAFATHATKFLLPPGGRIIHDADLKGLDDEMELKLPYTNIALEVQYDSESKAIVFARQEDDNLIIVCCRHVVSPELFVNGWSVIGVVFLPRIGFKQQTLNGVGLRIGYPVKPSVIEEFKPYIAADVWTLVHFLNALACSNVHIERSEPKKAGKKIKAALPFDAYHYLTIDAPAHAPGVGKATGGHRSPREHLRRGHIRRLADGRRIWVNAAVINAGVGGKVTKDYRLRAPETA